MFGFRALDPDPRSAQALVDAVRITPFDGRAAPATRIISPHGRPWSGDQPSGLEYWARLHDIYQAEMVDERDRFYLAMLRHLGIEKGQPFAPSDRLRHILTQAAAAGELMAQANTFAKRFEGARFWPDRQWELAIVLSNTAQRGTYYDELLERAFVVLRGGQLLRGHEKPDAGSWPGLPRDLHRRCWRLARRRQVLHAACARGRPGQAVLVRHGVHRRRLASTVRAVAAVGISR
jgi:hypothetical protein